MPNFVTGASNASENLALANMFRERKRIFIDLLKWDVPVLAGCFEVDQFDGIHTTYLVLADPDGTHLGSMRLLPSQVPNILNSIFPHLCEGALPAAPDIWEISRFCLSRDLRAAERLVVRNQLISVAVIYALQHDIRSYCCVADMRWFSQILSFGWRCLPLGMPQQLECGPTAALRIEIDDDTPDRMAMAGTWLPPRGLEAALGTKPPSREAGHAIH
ncbi:MAG: autoinducer synthesis protein [Novosphingobium sp.]|nr:autoinducer synthesis protein [Novosphingobium sp.]